MDSGLYFIEKNEHTHHITGRTEYIYCIGFVVGVKENGIERLFGKDGNLTKYTEKPKVFKTEEQSLKFIEKIKSKNLQPFNRKYYYYTYDNYTKSL